MILSFASRESNSGVDFAMAIQEAKLDARKILLSERVRNYSFTELSPEASLTLIDSPRSGATFVRPKLNTNAELSFIFGVVSVVTIFGLPLAPAAVVLGIIALNQLLKRDDEIGKGFAIAGIILGGLGTLAIVAYAVLAYLLLIY